MKRIAILLGAILTGGVLLNAPAIAADPKPAAAPAPVTAPTGLSPHVETLDSETNQVSYAVGINLARNLQYNYPNLNIDFFILALHDVYSGAQPQLSEDMINAAIAKYQTTATEVARKRLENISEYNLKSANRFLETNGKREGVITTPSGLQYRMLHESTNGPAAAPGSTITMNLTTKLADGSILESTSLGDRKPKQINLNEAIKAWQEALTDRHIGTKLEIYAPPNLAYGERGASNVGPNQLLIFEIEILGIN